MESDRVSITESLPKNTECVYSSGAMRLNSFPHVTRLNVFAPRVLNVCVCVLCDLEVSCC